MNEYSFKANANGKSAYCDFVICDMERRVLMAAVFDRSKQKALSICLEMAYATSSALCTRLQPCREKQYKYSSKIMLNGYDRVSYCTMYNTALGKEYILTTEDTLEDDFYNYLMNNFTLPILREWIPTLLKTAVNNYEVIEQPDAVRVSALSTGRTISLGGKKVKLTSLKLFKIQLTQEGLESIVSNCLKRREIKISDNPAPPLEFENMDEYLSKYGKTLADNLEKKIVTLSPLNGKVDALALKEKSLYPQQAACVNGIKALRKEKKHYGLMIEGMGVGKTVQGMSVCESYFAEKWLEKHKDKDLKDLYSDPDALNYRNIVVCPGHLVKKWAQEIASEIPYAKVHIIDGLGDLIKIKEGGRERKGREFYIIGKDKAKLSTTRAPMPVKIGSKRPTLNFCMDCLQSSIGESEYEEIAKKPGTLEPYDIPYNRVKMSYQSGVGKSAKCSVCGGNNFRSVYALGRNGIARGLLCPHCGELLQKVTTKNCIGDENLFERTLWPNDFSNCNESNKVCYHCGGVLWGYDCKPVGTEPKESPWKVIKYFSTARRDKTKKALVLKGHEKDFLAAYQYGEPEILPHEYGVRRYAPSDYAKKHLKGFFDFCILDEVHKFEGFKSAQSIAAHSFMRCSDFTIGLTGTISNGSAASFFSLLYRLAPSKMKKLGYEFDDASLMKFSRHYGVVEQKFEDDGSGAYNKTSRGKSLTSPQVKPGISPVLFVDFLMDCSVFLDLSDLSKYLPPLREKVITVDMPDKINASYCKTINDIKRNLRTKEGAGLMSDMLQFGLSYPDKPYGRGSIMSVKVDDYVVAKVDSHDECLEGELLPKEKKLIEIVNQEISEGRNCFIYAAFTGQKTMNITGRIQSIIETQCNLRNRVEVLQSEKPSAAEREEYLHKRAADGIKVFICNPKIVETGLDFCFSHEGVKYNYPTLIFYQMSYELAVVWQASRRHYRLNQDRECRTYWMAYAGTLQTAALEIMAKKQVATAAIQGKFSTEGLATLAKGVDARVELAKVLSEGDMSSRESLENMFDVMASGEDDERYASYEKPKTFYEITGFSPTITIDNALDFMTVEREEDDYFTELLKNATNEEKDVVDVEATITETVVEHEPANDSLETDSFNALFADLFGDIDDTFTTTKTVLQQEKPKKSRKQKKTYEEQVDLFELFA